MLLLVDDEDGRGVVFRGEPEHEAADLGAAFGLLNGLVFDHYLAVRIESPLVR